MNTDFCDANCANFSQLNSALDKICRQAEAEPSRAFMWQSYIYGMHWKHDGKMYYDEVPAESKEEAAEYFIDHKRDDVSLIRVELVGPNLGGVRELAFSPDSPFDPLKARRRTDNDEDAR